LWNYRSELAADLRQHLQQRMFHLESRYLSWTGNGEARFKAELAEDLFHSISFGSLLGDLTKALAPIPEDQILRVVDNVVIDDQTETAVRRVGVELMPLIAEKARASLHRIVPRYLAARARAVLSIPNQSQPGLEPAADQIPTSAPLDEVVLDALLSGVTVFDEFAYRNTSPIDDVAPPVLTLKGPGRIEFMASQGAPLWVRAGNSKATAEDVAAVLYGSSTLAYQIVAALPFFGIQPSALIEEPYRRLWLESLDAAGLSAIANLARLGYYRPSGSPLLQPPVALRDDIILSQAKGLAATGAARMEIVQKMRLALGLADQVIAASGKLQIGDGDALAAMRARLDARSRQIQAADSLEAEAWGPQAAAQFNILNEAAEALTGVAAKLEANSSDEIPGFIWEPLDRLASAWVDAALLSEFADAGRQQIAAARELSKSFTLDILEAKLRDVHDTLQAISPDDAEEMGIKTAPLLSREKRLRRELTRTRVLLRADPKRGVPAAKDLKENVDRLSVRAQAIKTFHAIEYFIYLLSANPFVIVTESGGGVAAGTTSMDTLAKLIIARNTWADIAKTAFDGKYQELRDKVKAAGRQQKGLNAVLKDAAAVAKESTDPEQVQEMIDRIEFAVAIAIVTMGVGEIVGIIAIGADLAETGAGVFFLTLGAESIAGTTLNAAAFGGWENFGSDLFWNFLTFGAMKGGARLFTAVYGAEFARTGLGAMGEFTTATAFGMVPTLLKARFEAGHNLTAEEARAVVRDNILQNIAMAIGMRLFHEPLPKLPSAGPVIGARIESLEETRKSLEGVAEKLAHTDSPDETALHDLATHEAELLAQQTKVLEDAAVSNHLSEADRAEVESARHDLPKAAEKAEAGRIMSYLEDAGHNQLVCEEGHFDEVKQFFQEPHPPTPSEPAVGKAPPPEAPKPAEVKDLPPDEVTHARRIEVKPTDGTPPFTVTERVPDHEKLIRDLQSQKEDAQLAAAKAKEEAIARGGKKEWKKKLRSATKPIYNIMERLQGVRLQRTLRGPRQRVLYDVKVVAIDLAGVYGGEAPNVNLVNAEGFAPRTFDNLAYESGGDGEVRWAQPLELKSEGVVPSSVEGGLTQGDLEANFLPKSKLAGQLRTTGSLRQRASDLGGTLVLKGRDVITNEEVIIRVEPERIGPERVTTYGAPPDVVVPDVAADGSSPFPLETSGPTSAAAPAPPRSSSAARTLDDILTSDRKSFKEPAMEEYYHNYVKKAKPGAEILDRERWARATRGKAQKALEKLLGKNWRKRRGGGKLPN
jgi:hypothetical protein